MTSASEMFSIDFLVVGLEDLNAGGKFFGGQAAFFHRARNLPFGKALFP
jgi:hypothetical protein